MQGVLSRRAPVVQKQWRFASVIRTLARRARKLCELRTPAAIIADLSDRCVAGRTSELVALQISAATKPSPHR